jgi:putative membrane protein
MAILITIAATLSAAIHVLIFYWESLAWTRPAVWKRFGLPSAEDAETTRVFAYNQGFYNLFLAIGALIGSVLYGLGATDAGFALGLFSVSCMFAAAIVLVTSGPGRIRAAAVQGFFPLITIVLYIVSWANER